MLIYEPIGMIGEVSQAVKDEVEMFHQASEFYCAQNWNQAERQLLNLQRMSSHTALYKIYFERINEFRSKSPSPDWDGVYVFQRK